MKVQRALISVSNKWNLEPFARGLIDLGVEIISTGGTAKFLAEAGIPITPVSEVTGFPEIMDGRIKTLHPAVHAGILADRRVHEHMRALQELKIQPIDLVVVNLYPFEETAEKRGVSEDEVIENIDIGGPTMVRAAAKNFAGVGVVVDPQRYDEVLNELVRNEGALTLETRRVLAMDAFHHTAHYDFAIANWFSAEEEGDFPTYIMWDFVKVQGLRYGVTHPAGTAVANVAHRIYRFLGASGRHQGLLPRQQAPLAKKRHHMFHDLRRFAHPSIALSTTGLPTLSRSNDLDPAGLQTLNIFLRGSMVIHSMIHCRSYKHRTLDSQQHCGQKVISQSHGHFGQHISRRRGHNYRIGDLRQRNVFHLAQSCLPKHPYMNRMTGQTV